MAGAITRLQDTNGYKRRGRRTADIANDIFEQLLHLSLEEKGAAGNMEQSATDRIIQCDLEWKTIEVPHECPSSALDERDLDFTMHGVNHTSPKSEGNAGDGIAAIKRGRHDVGKESPHEQGNVSNEGRNVLVQECWHSGKKETRDIQAGCTAQHAAHVGQLELDDRAHRHVASL